jgi:hypothetical protein
MLRVVSHNGPYDKSLATHIYNIAIIAKIISNNSYE